MNQKEIECHDLENQADTLAKYMPNGDLFAAKNIPDTFMRDLLKGFAGEMVRAESYLKDLQDSYIPGYGSDTFLTDWERCLGIPDDCFKVDGVSSEDRQLNVQVKLASLGVQTAEDFENLAAIYGLTVTVQSGVDVVGSDFPITFPFVFGDDITDPEFTIVVGYSTSSLFPITFPHTFGSDVEALLECLFNKLKPANCVVIFKPI